MITPFSTEKNSVILQKNNKCLRDSSLVLQKVQDGESTKFIIRKNNTVLQFILKCSQSNIKG